MLRAASLVGSQLLGTTTNDSAAAGNVGEFVASVVLVGSEISLTSTVSANVTSISLTAGDWDVFGVVTFDLAGTTSYTALICSSSTVSATNDQTDGSATRFNVPATVAGGPINLPIPVRRISVSSTTSVFLVAFAAFTVSTCGAYGAIRARRVR